MIGAIIEIDGREIKTIEDLKYVLGQYNPGDEVTVKTAVLEPGQGSVAETRSILFELTNK